MSFQIENYMDASGTTHPESYWTLVFEAADKPGKSLRFVYAGYHDKAAYDAGKASIGSKDYVTSGADFDAYLAGDGAALYAGISAGAAASALATLDTAKGEDGTPTSFFSGAREVE